MCFSLNLRQSVASDGWRWTAARQLTRNVRVADELQLTAHHGTVYQRSFIDCGHWNVQLAPRLSQLIHLAVLIWRITCAAKPRAPEVGD